MLLKDPEDDSMFEVELKLGATDETHIIRTIEYWATKTVSVVSVEVGEKTASHGDGSVRITRSESAQAEPHHSFWWRRK